MLHRLTTLSLLLVQLAILSPAFSAEDGDAVDIGYYALKPSIVSNLTGGPKYIRCDVQLMTEQASELPRIELHAAAVRHTLLMLIAGQDGNSLISRDGKESLRKAALTAVQEQLKSLTGKSIVNDLYFTAYYVK